MNTDLPAVIIAAVWGAVYSREEKDLMELGRRKVGELVALVGVVLAFIAIWVKALDVGNAKYADDGTVMAAAIIILGIAACALLASLLLGRTSLDLTAAVAGAAAFGFLLFQPAILAFKDLHHLSWGGWLGVCAGLIPLGAGAAHLWHKRSDEKAPGITLWTVAAAIGLLLIVIGIWSEIADKSGVSYWDASSSGHAIGLLLLLLVIVSAILIAVSVNAKQAGMADLALIVSAIAVGVAVAEGVHDAFGSFSRMGTGAWLELFGGLVLLLSLTVSRVVKLPELMKK